MENLLAYLCGLFIWQLFRNGCKFGLLSLVFLCLSATVDAQEIESAGDLTLTLDNDNYIALGDGLTLTLRLPNGDPYTPTYNGGSFAWYGADVATAGGDVYAMIHNGYEFYELTFARETGIRVGVSGKSGFTLKQSETKYEQDFDNDGLVNDVPVEDFNDPPDPGAMDANLNDDVTDFIDSLPRPGETYNGECVIGLYYVSFFLTEEGYGEYANCSHQPYEPVVFGTVPSGAIQVTPYGTLTCSITGFDYHAMTYAIFTTTGNDRCERCGVDCDGCDPWQDIDGDGGLNSVDDDNDNDGISNLCDADDPCNAPGDPCGANGDADGDGVINSCDSDVDIDGDGIADSIDATPYGSGCGAAPTCGAAGDVDGDDIRNDSEEDADGDGIPNDEDASPWGESCDKGLVGGCAPGDDFDGDGIRNDAETDADIDGDGIDNEDDVSPYGCGPGTGCECGPCEPDGDVDHDGEINSEDEDADNDGIPNDDDGCPLDCACCDEDDQKLDYACATCDEKKDLAESEGLIVFEEGRCLPVVGEETKKWSAINWGEGVWLHMSRCDWDGDGCLNIDDARPCDEEFGCDDCDFELDEKIDEFGAEAAETLGVEDPQQSGYCEDLEIEIPLPVLGNVTFSIFGDGTFAGTLITKAIDLAEKPIILIFGMWLLLRASRDLRSMF